ncbi:DegT/DnrJ/EryC1/StrS family aminotransferase [Rhodoferax sp.]|uniref:DegT/DnrJ/EryC1/StrS family aminotransferase n=1 Tax=Rhodoferax sp. TaxID=50421 RepID=UPI003454DAC8
MAGAIHRTQTPRIVSTSPMHHPTPRLPVLDWGTFSGPRVSATPCVLTHPSTQFTQSGRASILLALEMLEIGPGDTVLVPTYHCPTMIAPIVSRGAQPVFYPLDSTGAPNLEWINQDKTQGVRAILVAHFFGLPQPLTAVRQWCDQQGVRLIEDCAHALFGTSDDRAVGYWGDLAIASLTKFLPVPEGGCLLNNTLLAPFPELHQPKPKSQVKAGFDILHAGINHGRLNGLGTLMRSLFGVLSLFKKKPLHQPPPTESSSPAGFTIDVAQSHQGLTYPSRWIANHAPRERIVLRRRANYLVLAQALSGLRGMHPLRPDLPAKCAPYVFPLWVDHPDPGYGELRRMAFPVSRWDWLWPTVSKLPNDSGIQWSHHILQLACHQDLTPAELEEMISTLKRMYVPKAVESFA